MNGAGVAWGGLCRAIGSAQPLLERALAMGQRWMKGFSGAPADEASADLSRDSIWLRSGPALAGLHAAGKSRIDVEGRLPEVN